MLTRIVLSIAVLGCLSPVIGMVLVFAILPALPIVLAVGIVLGPMNLFPQLADEDDDEPWVEELAVVPVAAAPVR